MSFHSEPNIDRDEASSTYSRSCRSYEDSSRRGQRGLLWSVVSEDNAHNIPAGSSHSHASVQASNGGLSNTNHLPEISNEEYVNRSHNLHGRQDLDSVNQHRPSGQGSSDPSNTRPQDFGATSDRSANASRTFSNGQEFGGGPSIIPRPPDSRARSNSEWRCRENISAQPPSGRRSITREQSFVDDQPRHQNPPPRPHESHFSDLREHQQQYRYPHHGHYPNSQYLPLPDQSHHYQHSQGQSWYPQQRLYDQAHYNHHSELGWPRSTSFIGGRDLPSFSSTFGNAMQEHEIQSHRSQYPWNSAQAFPGTAFVERPTGSQRHYLSMADRNSSRAWDYGVGPSEPLPLDNHSLVSSSGQYGRANVERSSGECLSSHHGPSDVNVPLEAESGADGEVHCDPQSYYSKSAAIATYAPMNDEGKGRADAEVLENMNMEIIHETGRPDLIQKRRRGRPAGSKNKPKLGPETSEFNEAEATVPKKTSKKARTSKNKPVKASKPKVGSKHRTNKRAREPETEDEVDQLEADDEQDNTDQPDLKSQQVSLTNNDHPSSSGGSLPGFSSNPDGPVGPGGAVESLEDPEPLGGPDDTIDEQPQDHGYRYGGENATGGSGTAPPGSPIPPDAPLPHTPTVDTQLESFMNFVLSYQDSNGAEFYPQRGIVCYECHNQQQFQTFCIQFLTTFRNPDITTLMNILDGYHFELRLKLNFHWTNNHLIRLSNVLQEVKALYRLDLHVCTAEEINASRPKTPNKKTKVTRTTCCTSELMDLIHRSPNLREIRFRGVGTFFIRDFARVPDMGHVRVLEMDVDAWVPLQRYAGGAHPVQDSARYCGRFDQVLLKLPRLETLVLHCPDAPGAFMDYLVEMSPMMPILSHAKNIQHQPQIQRGGFLVRLQAHGTASAFEIGRLDEHGNMTDVHAVFTNSDHANLENWITDSRIPETSAFRGLFDHPTLWSHVERLTTTGNLPVWCMNALRARRHSQMTQLHGMTLQNMSIENEWWDHFLNLLANLHLQIFVMRDCAFPGNAVNAAEMPTDWTRLFNAVGQQGQVIGLGLVNVKFGDGGALLLSEFWNMVDERETREENAEGQVVTMSWPRWNALTWVDFQGSVNLNTETFYMYGRFIQSQEGRDFELVHVLDLDHYLH